MSTTETLEGKANVKNGVWRLLFAAFAILLEVAAIVVTIIYFNEYYQWISIATRILAFIMVLGIYSQYRTATMKMPWIVLIMGAPILGVTLYLMIGLNGSTWLMKRRYQKIDDILLPKLKQNRQAQSSLERDFPDFANISKYLNRFTLYPVYDDTEVVYYPEATDALEAQLEELSRAKSFIFMEYHAIEDAESFRRIQAVLEKKVKEGVEVRLFYDDIGSIGFITTDFVKRMESLGIKCRVFNPVFPILNIFLNNRDHRKITVIDAKVGFTGGYNIANEYFNITHPYGYWKDTGVKLTGGAVKSLTVTFLEMWNAVRDGDENDRSFTSYIKNINFKAKNNRCYVQPYADSPLGNEHVGENVYISIAESAKRYVYFITPYLIITDEMMYALGMAAKRGVDVRIITPGVPDKKLVYSLTRSYYAGLARNGVRIFEYTPGFCHCKMSIADDAVATCGTINLDYRSLYHHFENGCIIYGGEAVDGIKRDFDRTFKECREVTEKYRSTVLRMWQLILRLFAPLM